MHWLGRHFTFAWDRFTIVQCLFTCFCVFLIPFSRPEWARELGLLELVQAGIIIAGGVQAGLAGMDKTQPQAWRRFWNWSIWCWVLVLGRTVNWGRVFFSPSYPRVWFRMVCIALVAGTVVHFFWGGIYRMAWRLVSQAPWPFWIILFGVAAFFVVDTAEHARYGIMLAKALRDLIEECMEMAVFAALLLMARSLIVHTGSAAEPASAG